MGTFIDEEDQRRPQEFPRLSERYRADVEAVWFPPSRRKLVKGKPVAIKANVLDLSVAGALLTSQINSKIEIGRKIKFQLNGHPGIVEVRNVRPSSSPDISYYGVSFFNVSDDLRAEIFEIVTAVRSGAPETRR